MSEDSQLRAHQRALELVYAGRLHQQGEFFEVPTATFFKSSEDDIPHLPPISFYRLKASKEFERMRTPDQPCSALALLLQPTVWIHQSELAGLLAFAEDLFLGSRNGSIEPSLEIDKRMEGLRRTAILVCEDLFENPSPENINKSAKLVGSFVYAIMKEPKAYFLLSRLSSHDPYTLQHSVGTAVQCIILGKKNGITREHELTDLGTAGLLHDIGKTKIKKEIINKPGPLDPNEWDEMHAHPVEGFEIVKVNPLISIRAKNAILEHHEDKNGTGYPFGKKSLEMDLFSRIVGICDIFNALTTNRSYSQARTPFEALHFMKEKLAMKVDEDLFKQLVLIYGGKCD
ncbi:HD domain-containing phosphohydrolase [Bdellovibrionota bacterium FG-1]